MNLGGNAAAVEPPPPNQIHVGSVGFLYWTTHGRALPMIDVVVQEILDKRHIERVLLTEVLKMCGTILATSGPSSADEQELEVLDPTLDTDPVDEGKSRQQELEQREDEGHGEDDRPQQEVNDLAAVVTTERGDDTHPSDEDGSPRPAER